MNDNKQIQRKKNDGGDIHVSVIQRAFCDISSASLGKERFGRSLKKMFPGMIFEIEEVKHASHP